MPNGDVTADSDHDGPPDQGASSGSEDRTAQLAERARELAQNDGREAIQELLAMLASKEQLVRWQVVDSLALLANRLKRRNRVRWTAAFSSSSPLTFDELVELAGSRLRDLSLDREAVAHRVALADAVGLWHDEAVTPLLVESLEADSAPIVRATAATALGKVQDRHAIDALMTALSDPSFWVRRAAADALGVIGDPRAIPALRQALADLDDTCGSAAETEELEATKQSVDDALQEAATVVNSPDLGGLVGHRDRGPETTDSEAALVKGSLVSALGNMDTARARSTLILYTEDPSSEIRWRAARGLAQIGDASALPALRLLLQDEAVYFGRPVSQVASLAMEAINRDERGLGSLVRKGFYFAWHEVRRRVIRR